MDMPACSSFSCMHMPAYGNIREHGCWVARRVKEHAPVRLRGLGDIYFRRDLQDFVRNRGFSMSGGGQSRGEGGAEWRRGDWFATGGGYIWGL